MRVCRLFTCAGLSSMMALRISMSFCLEVSGPCKNLHAHDMYGWMKGLTDGTPVS